MSKSNQPLRGPKYRSRAFQEYLLTQTPERRAEILAGESAYNSLRQDPGSVAGAAEIALLHDLTDKIPMDPPAGITDRLDLLEDPLLPLYGTSSGHE